MGASKDGALNEHGEQPQRTAVVHPDQSWPLPGVQAKQEPIAATHEPTRNHMNHMFVSRGGGGYARCRTSSHLVGHEQVALAWAEGDPTGPAEEAVKCQRKVVTGQRKESGRRVQYQWKGMKGQARGGELSTKGSERPRADVKIRHRSRE